MIKQNPSKNLVPRPRAGWFTALFLLAGLLALATPLRADLPPTFLFQINSAAVPGAIFYPNYVALDSSNNVYAPDTDNNRVVKLAGNGSYLTQWGTYGTNNGQLNYPETVAVDSSNNVYVVDADNYRVEKFDGNGNYLGQWGSFGTNNGQFSSLVAVAVDRSNNVYVSDGNNYCIKKFDGNGNYLTRWGSFGTNNGQFYYPGGVAVDSSNNIYVTDLYNDRVEKFDSNGNYLTQWGSGGTNNGQFEFTGGIAVDSSNHIYVTDLYNYRVEKFDSNGNYLALLGTYGSGPGQFGITGPAGIAVDSSNNVYVADDLNSRVETFDDSGNYLTQWGTYGTNNGQFKQYSPQGVAVDSSNNVYVVDAGNNRVEKFNSSGVYLTQWGSFGTNIGQFAGPYGIAVDSSGNFIYVADYGNHRIQVFVNNTNIVPPIITGQPMSQTVPAGAHATFSVRVFGTAPFSYQWMSNSVAVTGATNATFTLTNVSLTASGSTYSVLVTNSFGSELGSNAVLTVFPALVITQPATGRSANGAVLNGSVTVGPDQTVVWFDWGTDTNYGNIAGAAIVPGNNASNNISALLNGVPGNFYHYRMDAANDFGVVYGQDQLFTVGFAPATITLFAINSANGSTLQAAVNPEGWDTTVYFKWVTPTLTNTTPVMDIGAGAASLNVSSFVSGLASFPTYQYQVVASNALGIAVGQSPTATGSNFDTCSAGRRRISRWLQALISLLPTALRAAAASMPVVLEPR